MKHLVPLLLTLALLLSLAACGGKTEEQPASVPAPAPAQSAESAAPVTVQEPASPVAMQAGPAAEWQFADGTLTISGQGATDEYELLKAPWDRTGVSLQVKKLVVEEGITGLGANLCSACCNLTSVSLPDTLEYIGEFAFADCAELKSVELPSALRTIDENAFMGSGLTAITLPQGLADVESGAFGNCAQLKSAAVPGSLVKLGEDVFDGCDALETVSVPEGALAEELLRDAGLEEQLRLTAAAPDALNWSGKRGALEWSLRGGVLTVSGVTELPDFAASAIGAAPWSPMGSTVEKLVISGDVERIGSYAFWNLSHLSEVELPAALTEIGDYAFGACGALETLSLPRNLRSIGAGAFAFCQGLTELTLPEGLESVGDDAFRMCSGVTRVTAPASLTSIGTSAFDFGGAEYPEVNAPAGSAAAEALTPSPQDE